MSQGRTALCVFAFLLACSSKSSGSGSCEQSGSFSASVSPTTSGVDSTGAACDCPLPAPLSVSVAWNGDGTATVNGASCVAICGAGGTPTTCSSLGEPPADTSESFCGVNLFCCDAGGLAPCTGFTGVDQVTFNADGQPKRVQVAVVDGATGCFCNYFSGT